MPTRRKAEPITEGFKSYEEASDYWDEHDSAEYEDILEAVDIAVDLPLRHYVIELDKRTAEVLMDKAQEEGIGPNRLASKILHEVLKGCK